MAGVGMENQGYASTTHPEMQSTNPNMVGGATEKKGIADKVKGLLGGHGHKTDAAHQHQQQQQQSPVYGDATPATGTAESTRVGCLDKLKAKTGVGHGLAPAQTRQQGGGLAGHHAGGGVMDPSTSPDYNGGTNVNSSAAVHGGWPHPTNPNEAAGLGAHHNQPTGLPNPMSEPHHNRETHNHPTGLPNPMSEPHHNRETHNHPTGLPNPFSQPNSNAAGTQGYGGAQPTNPTGMTNAQGGAVLGDHQGNAYEGPRDDIEKKEGFVSKIMDKLHSPKGKPAHNTTTTTPSTY
ncbi:hypothetical protein M758_1G098000 [Ceratodon purpureus]|uniref:Dehydrin n=1 Tax=Ceratodon purpureus TaxID=3225 RepID=A0A8T0J6Y0_CERPU|nr:hypothetical protein KC19_1G108600 [Ceratodon purpureus]KAG0629367.1 hypothetical protein M758_1G098000 [Ceratodon purpureus]